MMALMKSTGAGLAGKVIRDISLSNNPFLIDSHRDGTMAKMPQINRPGGNPVCHCLGAALFFHRSCFDAITDYRRELGTMFFEVALPTVAALKNFRLLSFDQCSDLFQYIRYRPIYSPADALEAARKGASMIHPLKDFGAFAALRDDGTITG